MTRLLILCLFSVGCMSRPVVDVKKADPKPSESALTQAAERFPDAYSNEMAKACGNLADQARDKGWSSFDAMYSDVDVGFTDAQERALKPTADLIRKTLDNDDKKPDGVKAEKMFRDMAKGFKRQ